MWKYKVCTEMLSSFKLNFEGDMDDEKIEKARSSDKYLQ